MNKEDNPLFSYAALDSQRLKETFFSPPKKKQQKDFLQKKLIITAAGVIVALLFIASYLFLTNYQVIAVSRQGIQLEKNGLSLLRSRDVASLSFVGNNTNLIKKGHSFVHIATAAQEKTGLIIDLKKPTNFISEKLIIYIKKSASPLKVGVVLRDTRNFSNSLRPVMVDIKNEDQHTYTKAVLEFNSDMQNTNLSQITQIQISFYPYEQASAVQKNLTTERWVLLRELLIVHKDHDTKE